MISRRFQFRSKRLRALVGVLGVLGGGGMMVDAHKPAGDETVGAPQTLVSLHGATLAAGTGSARAGCSPQALHLIGLVNAYRADNGLPAIPASPSLCTVAAAHTRDLADHAPHAQRGCNLHSWSDNGDWTPCCYTDDHAQAACMWNKPRELTEYGGNGFENAAGGVTTPDEALRTWRSSAAHDAVILSRNAWRSHPWRAIGADIHGGFAVLWFGEEADPALSRRVPGPAPAIADP